MTRDENNTKKSEYKTTQKKRLLDFLAEHKERHFTIDEISDSLNDGTENAPGKSTIYRQISNLLEDGTVLRFEAPGSKSFVYQYADLDESCEHHFHLKCVKCGKFIHMECPALSKVQMHVYEEHGFAIGCGKSVIYGECAECLRKDNEEK